MAKGACQAAKCADVLRNAIRESGGFGTEAVVSTEPPLVQGYPPVIMRCPHGVTWYAEPTGEQRAAWASGGVA